jgi:signal transduction histidine kinase/CheY-like chemotaxis protein
MNTKLDKVISFLTSGKYRGIKDEKDMDAIIRLIVLNITYSISSIIIACIGITDMRSGIVDQGLLELITGFLIFLNLMLLRTELPFMVGGFILTAVFGFFCGFSIFTHNEAFSFPSLWIYSYPLISIYTMGMPFGLVPALLLFFVAILGTFFPGFTNNNYSVAEASLICGVYFFVLTLTAIYEYVRSIKDNWLSRQDSYMNMVFQNSPDIILLLDSNGGLVYCADEFLKKTRIRYFASIRKIHYAEVFSRFCEKDQLDEIEHFFNRAREERKPVVLERVMDIGRDGNKRHYDIHFTPMYNEDGVFQGAFILFHDMTDIMLAKIRTEQASMAKTNFLASMSHEIRTPLNAIIGMTTIATTSPEPERKDYCLSKISGASAHLLGIINDILDMSKIEEGKLELSNTEFSYSSMLNQVTSIFEFRIKEKKLVFTVNTDPLIPDIIVTDKQRLTQVITNLISNSIKFTPEEGSISLDSKLLDINSDENTCTLEIKVTDTGIGIAKEEQDRLFHSFVQVDSSISRKFGGTGLGLAISKKITEMMHGDIRIESELGKGAAFIVTIKAEMKKQDAVSSQSDSITESAVSTESFKGKQILLVEDVEINREIVIAFLEDFGVEITEAEDGQQAFDVFAAAPEKFDLIFMDIHMPGMDGYESTKLIRALDNPRAKTVPIIAMTANVFREDVEHCLAAGMNDHLGKPLDLNDIIRILNKYLGKS